MEDMHPPLPAPTNEAPEAVTPAVPPVETAVEPVAAEPIDSEAIDSTTLRPPVARMPVEVDVAVPVPEFRVRHLLTLEPGQVLETQWGQSDDLPLAAGDVQLAWSEFEVLDSRLAVRVTRLG